MTDNNATALLTLWLEMTYIGYKGKQFLGGLKRKLKRCLNISDVRIVTKTTTIKLNMFTNVKDKTSLILCMSSRARHVAIGIGKTERTLLEGAKELAYNNNDSAVNKHLQS